MFQHPREVDVRLPEKENSNYHGARPVHQIISVHQITSMIEWIRTSWLAIKSSLSVSHASSVLVQAVLESLLLEAFKMLLDRAISLSLVPSYTGIFAHYI